MAYVVTFCATDQSIGSNPLWHGAFLLSALNEETKQLEVTDTWGYYAAPSVGDPNSWFSKLKQKVAFDTDFSGTHGWLKHEEFRYMDRGHGLHGKSFEITEEQYKKLQNECAKRVKDQEDAVKEALQELGLGDLLAQDKSADGKAEKIRLYQGEKYADKIYALELQKAKEQGRPPRLHPFNLTLGLSSWGMPTFEGSHTCKSEALDILGTVLSKEQLAPFHASTFPRLISGTLEPVLLHSVGPLDIFTKSNKQRVFFRKKETPGTQINWTVLPQNIEARPGTHLDKLFAIDKEYCAEVKAVVSKLQRLEWFFRNATIPEKYKAYRDDLVQYLIDCYTPFSIAKPKVETRPKASGWYGAMFSLFDTPKNMEQAELQNLINNSKYLFNELFMALADGWIIRDDLPSEAAVKEDGVDCNPLAALASYLCEEGQKELCSMLGRSYVEPEEFDENIIEQGAARAVGM